MYFLFLFPLASAHLQPLPFFIHITRISYRCHDFYFALFSPHSPTHLLLVHPRALDNPLIRFVYFHKCLYAGPCLLASQPRGLTGGFKLCTRVGLNSTSAPATPWRAMTPAVFSSQTLRNMLKPTGVRLNLSRKDFREKPSREA